MDPNRFDAIARALGGRFSRRTGLRTGAAGFIAALAAKETAAQDGTPAPSATPAPTGAKPEIMFVQGYQAGHLALQSGTPSTFSLTLTGGLGHTVYFSDRPQRIVGAIPTDKFFKAMTFPASNPPNAALLMQVAPNDEDVAVVELTNPAYDASNGTATYTAKVLSNYQQLGFGFQETPQDARSVHQEFGAASLFIDDGCGHHSITCCTGFEVPDPPSWQCQQTFGSFSPDFCWEFGDFCCHPCSGSQSDWVEQCNNTYSGCNGKCNAVTSACW